jgi:gamma-tubulin complex component 3
VSKPFFSTLHRWLFSGELYDPFSEFFVAIDPELAHVQYVHPSAHLGGLGADAGILFGGDGEAPDVSGEREGGQRLWETKYRFRKDMLPMFVGEAFGRKASWFGAWLIAFIDAIISIDIFHGEKSELYPV